MLKLRVCAGSSTRIEMRTGRLFCNAASICVTWPGKIDKFSKMIGTGWEWYDGNATPGWCGDNTSFVWVADAVCFNLIRLCAGWVLSPTATISLRRLFASKCSVSSLWIVLFACSRMLIMALLKCSDVTCLTRFSLISFSTKLVTSRNSLSRRLICSDGGRSNCPVRWRSNSLTGSRLGMRVWFIWIRIWGCICDLLKFNKHWRDWCSANRQSNKVARPTINLLKLNIKL